VLLCSECAELLGLIEINFVVEIESSSLFIGDLSSLSSDSDFEFLPANLSGPEFKATSLLNFFFSKISAITFLTLKGTSINHKFS